MPFNLRELLDGYRTGSRSEREKGTYFERLTKVWLEIAPTQADQFLRVLTFGEWAAERGQDRRDVGIDLCAQLADDPDSWCAIVFASNRFSRSGTYELGGASEIAPLSPHSTIA